ncbi:MAG: precorrin-6y C5,15-methyltransferase (decarboxylating) subunit CbiE [Hyphomicrobiales bacterium]|nr:precorrin-6y C5,15-methyltransferase (decarboxylating) subunit CbiE [Hyphomicrobiales bacterium]
MTASQVWLTIVGIGDDGWDGLSVHARDVVEQSGCIIGSERQLRLLPDSMARRGESWSGDITSLLEGLKQARKKHGTVCLLASGDPMWHGLGASLSTHLDKEEFCVLPGVSSRSWAAARLGWALQEVTCLSLHNRPVNLLHAHIAPRARLLLLSRDGDTPAMVAKLLCERGYGSSVLRVLEHLGGERERIRETSAEGFNLADIASLNMVAVEVGEHCGRDDAALFGLADDLFAHDGNITRRDLRAMALARLACLPGALLWDVGAGSGSLSVEWMRLHHGNRAIAIEAREDRCRLIESNRDVFGVPGLDICTGTAPEALKGLPAPDAIFVGGGVSTDGVLAASWNSLRAGGCMVAHAVSVEGEAALVKFRREAGGELLRIGCERLDALGSMEGWRPLRSIVTFSARKNGAQK